MGVTPDAAASAYVQMLAARDAKRGDLFALVMRSVASLGTGVEAELREQLGELERIGRFVAQRVDRVSSTLERGRTRCGGEIATFPLAHQTARQLARELRASRILPRTSVEEDYHGPCWLDPDEPEEPGRGTGRGRSRSRHSGGRARRGRGQTACDAGRLEIRHAPLEIRLRGRGAGRGWRPAREGSSIRYLHRWTSDRAIFRRRRRGYGAISVLVDTSGSMRLEERDLEKLLQASPLGARVAMYSGEGDAGELRIVAWGDRRAAAEHLAPYGSGNIVDVPALEWLARQPAPRIWISDGGVTGIHDQRSARVEQLVADVCKQRSIARVETIDEAVTRVTGGRRRNGS
jgi:hypothetical protein